MTHHLKPMLIAPILLILFSVSTIMAQSEATVYDLSWWTVDGGGGTLSEGAFSLSGTIGQPEVGQELSGNGYTLVGGLWYGVASPEWYDLHLPVVLRSY
jgi:hypothetical protein